MQADEVTEDEYRVITQPRPKADVRILSKIEPTMVKGPEILIQIHSSVTIRT